VAAIFLVIVISAVEGDFRTTAVWVSVAITCAVFWVLWVKRYRIRSLLGPISFKKFILFGFLFGMLVEFILDFSVYLPEFPSNPEYLLLVYAVVAPNYVLMFTAWAWLIKKYSYTIFEVFFLFGVNGFVIEEIIIGDLFTSPVGSLLSFPINVTIYGVMILLPYFLILSSLQGLRRASGKWKYLLGILAPSLLVLPYVRLVALVFA
jgi:hypothetical protein